AAVGRLAAVAERSSDETPDRIATEARGERGEQHMTERMRGDRAERTLLVRDLPALADHQIEGKDADDPVDERARYEAGTRQHRERGRPDEALTGAPWRAQRCIRLHRPHLHRAPASERRR